METFPDDSVHDDPGQQQEAEEVGLDPAHLLNTRADVQNLVAGKQWVIFLSVLWIFSPWKLYFHLGGLIGD